MYIKDRYGIHLLRRHWVGGSGPARRCGRHRPGIERAAVPWPAVGCSERWFSPRRSAPPTSPRVVLGSDCGVVSPSQSDSASAEGPGHGWPSRWLSAGADSGSCDIRVLI